MNTCLEAAALTDVTGWTKSRRSGAAGHCVELAEFGGGIILRNSNSPQAGALAFTKAEISAFVGGARDGDFDHLTV